METKMQKLEKRKTYIPTDTSLVSSSMVLSLNKEETLSEQDLKTFSNNSEENHSQHTGNQNLRVSDIVYVQNIKGQPLMPCKQQKANKLLKQGKAVVAKRKPFTIQLTIATGETTQPITLGVDAGSKVIGFSAITEKKELISGELELRQDVSDKLTERAMYRRGRRNKLWYREPRFNNRKREEGWLAPSIQHKLDTHQTLINKITKLLPINNVVVEVAKFDTQKLQNADIEGVEYQQGQMSEYNNLRAFIFTRDNYTCQICKEQGGVLETHHIIQRKDGGSNRPDNLVTLHLKCHKDFHSGKIKHEFTKPKSFKDTSIMNNVWTRLVDKNNYEHTFGYITKEKRQKLELEKSHVNDAFVIAGGSNQTRCRISDLKQIRRNNRCLQLNRKGFAPSIRRQRYKIQPNDLVKIDKKQYMSKGSFNKGTWIKLTDNYGNTINKNIENIELVKYGKGIQI